MADTATQEVVFNLGEIIVVQGHAALDLFILRSGQAVVVADPDFKQDSGVKASIDMSKCIQVRVSVQIIEISTTIVLTSTLNETMGNDSDP